MKPSHMHRFTLLLASNEDPHTHMAKAKASLDAYFNDTLIWSRIHESSPYGVMALDALPYLNAVCQGRTSQDLEAFIGWLKALETSMGRRRGVAAKGRVTLDLDVVTWDDVVLRPVDAERSYYLTCMADLPSTV